MVSLELPDIIPNQIGGADRPAEDGRTFAKVDPATGQLICRVAQSSAATRAPASSSASTQIGPSLPQLPVTTAT